MSKSAVNYIPSPFLYHGSIEILSCPALSTKEYHARNVHCPLDDELVTVRSHGSHGSSGMLEQRSILCRSPTLAKFFGSRHYFEGTATALWFLNVHSTVLLIAVQYMFFEADWLAPTLSMYTMKDRIYIYIRVYFFAKRLQLHRLENEAFGMLITYENHVGPEELVDMAPIIYENPDEKDFHIRNYFQKSVQKHIRELLTLHEWRVVLRDTRPSLAADMFELVTTIYMEGHASPYPPKLPQPIPQSQDEYFFESPPANASLLRHRSSALTHLNIEPGRRFSEKFLATDSLRGSLCTQSTTDEKQSMSLERNETVPEEAVIQEIIVDSKSSPRLVNTVPANANKAARVLGINAIPLGPRSSIGSTKQKGKRFLSKFSAKAGQ